MYVHHISLQSTQSFWDISVQSKVVHHQSYKYCSQHAANMA